MRIKNTKVITKLVIVIIFSLLLIDTSWGGIIPTIERNEIIPASNSKEWKSPSEMAGGPQVKVERPSAANGWRETIKEFDANGNLTKQTIRHYYAGGERINSEIIEEYNVYGGVIARRVKCYEYHTNGLVRETFKEYALFKKTGYLILTKEGSKEYANGKLRKEHFKEYGTKGIRTDIVIRDVTREYNDNEKLIMEYRKEKYGWTKITNEYYDDGETLKKTTKEGSYRGHYGQTITEYYRSGIVKSGSWRGDNPNNFSRKEYYEDGTPKMEIVRKRIRHGWSEIKKEFYPNGNLQKKTVKTFRRNRKYKTDMGVTEYYESGAIKSHATGKLRNGKFAAANIEEYYESGQLKRQICNDYNSSGLRESKVWEYRKDGSLKKKKKTNYAAWSGVVSKWKEEFYESGNLKRKVKSRSDKYIKIWEYYDNYSFGLANLPNPYLYGVGTLKREEKIYLGDNGFIRQRRIKEYFENGNLKKIIREYYSEAGILKYQQIIHYDRYGSQISQQIIHYDRYGNRIS